MRPVCRPASTSVMVKGIGVMPKSSMAFTAPSLPAGVHTLSRRAAPTALTFSVESA